LLAIIRFAGGDTVCLDFGEPLEPRGPLEQHVRAILDNFEARKLELFDIGFNDAVPTLVTILEKAGDDPKAILPPVRALGYLGRPIGWNVVSAHALHRDPAVRLAVIRSLGQMGKFNRIKVVQAFLDSPIRAEKREAIIALGKFATPDLIPEIEAAAGPDPELQKLAEEAKQRIQATLQGIETRDFTAFVDAVIDTDEYEDILPLMMMCWPPLKRLLGDTTRSYETRRRALYLLGCAGMVQPLSPMRKIVLDPEEPLDLKIEAIFGLGRIRTRSIVPHLIELLDHDDEALRNVSIDALGRIGDSLALTPLLDRWEANDETWRLRVRLALSRMYSVSGVPALLQPLQTYQPRTIDEIYFVTDSLELISGYHRELIEPMLASSVPAARRDALLLLATFGTKDDNDDLTRFRDTDADSLNQEIANLGIERLKDIPLWDRP
jgi:HEAT repeat protein